MKWKTGAEFSDSKADIPGCLLDQIKKGLLPALTLIDMGKEETLTEVGCCEPIEL